MLSASKNFQKLSQRPSSTPSRTKDKPAVWCMNDAVFSHSKIGKSSKSAASIGKKTATVQPEFVQAGYLAVHHADDPRVEFSFAAVLRGANWLSHWPIHNQVMSGSRPCQTFPICHKQMGAFALPCTGKRVLFVGGRGFEEHSSLPSIDPTTPESPSLLFTHHHRPPTRSSLPLFPWEVCELHLVSQHHHHHQHQHQRQHQPRQIKSQQRRQWSVVRWQWKAMAQGGKEGAPQQQKNRCTTTTTETNYQLIGQNKRKPCEMRVTRGIWRGGGRQHNYMA